MKKKSSGSRKTALRLLAVLLVLAAVLQVSGAAPLGIRGAEGKSAHAETHAAALSAPRAADPRPALAIRFFGVGDAPAAAAADPTFSAEDVGKTFWVGVTLDKLPAFRFGDGTGPLLTDTGMFSLEFFFEYRSDFITPAAEAAMIAQNTALWPDGVYEALALDGLPAYDQDAFRDGVSLNSGLTAEEAAAVKGLSVVFRHKDGAAGDSRFKAIASADEQVLAYLPFTLEKLPGEEEKVDPLRFVLAPVFNIGAGSDGVTPSASWEKTDKNSFAQNLKNLIAFAGDLKLFGDTSDGLTALAVQNVPVADEEGNTPAPTTYTLWHTPQGASGDDPTAPSGFQSDQLEYYLRVPNDTAELTVLFAPGASAALALGYGDVDTGAGSLAAPHSIETGPCAADDGADFAADGYKNTGSEPTDDFPLGGQLPLHEMTRLPGLSEEDTAAGYDTAQWISGGYNNEITVTLDGTVYTLHVQRLLKPQIKLNYGNSPYGLIARDTSIDQQAARDYFDINNRFAAGNVPYKGNPSVRYTVDAWGGSSDVEVPVGTEELAENEYVNYDKDETALFAYFKESFTDPGVSLLDALGRELAVDEDNKITRRITVDIMSGGGNIRYFTEGVLEGQTFEKELIGEANENDVSDLSTLNVRPGIYSIEYLYEDQIGNACSAKRALILLTHIGDIDMDTGITQGDISLIDTRSVIPLPGPTTAGAGRHGRVFLYRIIDVDKDTGVTMGDISSLDIRGVVPLIDFYISMTDLLK